jgi:hypothetical protein
LRIYLEFALLPYTYLTPLSDIRMTTVDTENYFAIAISDDLASGSATIGSTPSGETDTAPAPQDDKASRKAKRDERIAEAVRRSRVEYTPENVYTERGVCPSLSHFMVVSELMI